MKKMKNDHDRSKVLTCMLMLSSLLISTPLVINNPTSTLNIGGFHIEGNLNSLASIIAITLFTLVGAFSIASYMKVTFSYFALGVTILLVAIIPYVFPQYIHFFTKTIITSIILGLFGIYLIIKQNHEACFDIAEKAFSQQSVLKDASSRKDYSISRNTFFLSSYHFERLSY